MTDVVSSAVLRAQLDPSNFQRGAQQVQTSADQMNASVSRVDTTITKAGRDASLSADGFQRYLARIDEATHIGQQYARDQDLLNRYQAAGLVSTTDLAIAQGALKARYEGTIPTVNRFGSEIGLLRGAVAQLGIAFSVASVVQWESSLVHAAGSLKDKSEQLGVTVAGLQAYREVAREDGIATTTMDTALRRFNATIGTAVHTTGEQRDAFKELHLSARDIAAGPEAALPLVASSLLDIKDSSERARLEMILFGRSGQTLETALRDLDKPTSALIAQNYELGHAMRDDVAQAAKHAEDQLSESWNKIEVAVTPHVVQLAGALADVVTGLDKLVSREWSFVIRGEWQGALNQLGVGQYAKNAVGAFSNNGVDVFKLLGYGQKPQTWEEAHAGEPFVSPDSTPWSPATTKGGGWPLSDSERKAAAEAAAKALREQQQLLLNIDRIYQSSSKELIQQTHTQIERVNAYDAYIDKLQEGVRLARMSADEQAVEKALVEGRTKAELAGIQADEAKIRLLVQQTEEIKKQQALLDELNKGMTQDFQTFFSNWTQTGKADFASLAKSILGTWADMLAKMEAEAVMTNLFGKGGVGSGGGGIGWIIDALGLSSAPGNVGSGIASAASSIAAFADGGSFGAGQLALVGEQGPELVRFNSPGTVFPSGTGPGGGGHTINQYIDARGATPGMEQKIAAAAEAAAHRALARHAGALISASVQAVNSQVKAGRRIGGGRR